MNIMSKKSTWRPRHQNEATDYNEVIINKYGALIINIDSKY